MVNERDILKILWYVEQYGQNINNELFELPFEDYAEALSYVQGEGLIKGVGIERADDTVHELDTENISLTTLGIEYMKRIPDEIEKNILEVLNVNSHDGSLRSSQISNELFIPLSNAELKAYLKLLIDKDDIKEEIEKAQSFKSPFDKKCNTPIPDSKKYRISAKGIEFVKNNFQAKAKEYAPATVLNISAGIVNFGTIQNLNYIEELKEIIPEPDVREEIEKYFEEIKMITAEENVSKSKLATAFKKIGEKLAEKGLDRITGELMNFAWAYVMAQIMQ